MPALILSCLPNWEACAIPFFNFTVPKNDTTILTSMFTGKLKYSQYFVRAQVFRYSFYLDFFAEIALLIIFSTSNSVFIGSNTISG